MPTSTYVALATTTLASTDSEIVFSSIPASYRDLIIVFNTRSTYPGSTNDGVLVRLNGDTGANYSYIRMYGLGSGSGSSTASSGTTSMVLGRLNEGNTTAGQFSANIIQIMDYSATDKHKTALGRANVPNQTVYATAGRWANTSAVTSVTLTCPLNDFAIGSTFSLYGIEA